MVVAITLLVLLLAYAGHQANFYLQRRSLLQQDWGVILSRLRPVDVGAIEEIAANFLNPSKEQLRIEPTDMWERIGGYEGLEDLKANAAAMLDLAVYAAQWNQVEGRVVGEMIRRDAVRLRKASVIIQFALVSQLGSKVAPFQLQEAIAAYQLMRGRLLGLYQMAHVGLYPRLAEVL